MLSVYTKQIPVSTVPIRDLVPRIPPMSTHASIRVNNYEFSVTTSFTSYKDIIIISFYLIYFPSFHLFLFVRTFVGVPVCLLPYLSSPCKLITIHDLFEIYIYIIPTPTFRDYSFSMGYPTPPPPPNILIIRWRSSNPRA